VDQVREDLAEMTALACTAEPGTDIDLPEQLHAPDD